MKPWLHALLSCLLLAGGSAQAQDNPPAPEPLVSLHLGYAFERPDLLLKQRIFGLAHGIHLLLSGCLDKDENAVAAQQAYEAWHAPQRDALEAVRVALAAHHFGERAGQAQWQDIARVLGLKETIHPSLGAIPLQDACATLPEALKQPRYDFAAQLEMIHDVSRQ